MLVLTQKEGEILQVGDNVRIYIKRIRGNWVRLCIDAPAEVKLQRIPVPDGGEADRAHGSGEPEAQTARAEGDETQVGVVRRLRR